MLGFNRANNDLLVLLLLMGLTSLLAAKSETLRALGPLVIAFGALLKFYPILACLGLAFGRGRLKEELAHAAALAGLCALIAVPLREDYTRAIKGVLQNPGFYTFGAVLSPLTAAGCLAWLALAGGMVWGWSKCKHCAAQQTHELNEVGFAIGTGLLAGCFLVGVSFVYRLVFIVLILTWLWEGIRTGRERGWARAAVWGGVAVVWLDFVLMMGTVGSLLRGRAEWAHWIQAKAEWFRLPLQWAWVVVLLVLLAGLARSRWGRTEQAAP